MLAMDETTKTCASCSVAKPLAAFHAKGRGRLHSRCRTCRARDYQIAAPVAALRKEFAHG
jgi:hypothetical protein